jgi:AcrR family transcriptional regulator
MKARSTATHDASPARRKAPRREPPARPLQPAAGNDTKKRSTHRRSAEIIEAAAQVFAERGYHGATTQDIADVLNIRQASLYYYFSSKEVALELVCMRGVEGFFETAKAIASGPGSATERLSGLIRAHLSPLLDRRNFVKVFLTQRQFLPAHSRRKVGQGSRGVETVFEGVLKQGQRNGEFRSEMNTRLATLSILSVVNGCAAWYEREQVSIERIGSEFIRFVLNGVDKPADAREAKARQTRRSKQKI